MRIGILDDDPAICGTLRDFLRLNGHEVAVFNTPWDLLRALFSVDPPVQWFDVMIVDVLLPDLLGSRAIQRIRASFAYLPIIVISALPGPDMELIRVRFPTLTVFKKPISMNELWIALERIRITAQEVS